MALNAIIFLPIIYNGFMHHILKPLLAGLMFLGLGGCTRYITNVQLSAANETSDSMLEILVHKDGALLEWFGMPSFPEGVELQRYIAAPGAIFRVTATLRDGELNDLAEASREYKVQTWYPAAYHVDVHVTADGLLEVRCINRYNRSSPDC